MGETGVGECPATCRGGDPPPWRTWLIMPHATMRAPVLAASRTASSVSPPTFSGGRACVRACVCGGGSSECVGGASKCVACAPRRTKVDVDPVWAVAREGLPDGLLLVVPRLVKAQVTQQLDLMCVCVRVCVCVCVCACMRVCVRVFE